MDANHPLKKWRDTHGIGLDELAGRCGTFESVAVADREPQADAEHGVD